MKNENLLNNTELEKVCGGSGGLQSYTILEYCPKCDADRVVEVDVDPLTNREMHRCRWERTHFWYVQKNN